MKRAIYLKVNRNTKYAVKALQRWLDCVYYMNEIEDADGNKIKWEIKIICDNDELENKIIENCYFPIDCEISIIRSSASEAIVNVTNEICGSKWINAGMAHLTTFEDASLHEYCEFYNIDADDTVLAITTEHMAYMLKEVRDYAIDKQIDLFSLDMWMSVNNGKHWTFGITYTSNRINYMEIIDNHCKDLEYKARRKTGYGYNIDDFFTYLNNIGEVKAESFYFENLRFIHYSDDFFSNPTASGFYHYKNRTIMKPLEYYCFGMQDIGKIDIQENVIKLSCGFIGDVESQRELCKWAEKYDHYRFNKWPTSESAKRLIDSKVQKFFNYNSSKTVVFGVGGCFKRHESNIMKIPNLIGYTDNNSQLWGGEINGKKIFPIEELTRLANETQINVLIVVENENIQSNISRQIKKMGEFNILIIDDYLRLFDDAEKVI